MPAPRRGTRRRCPMDGRGPTIYDTKFHRILTRRRSILLAVWTLGGFAAMITLVYGCLFQIVVADPRVRLIPQQHELSIHFIVIASMQRSSTTQLGQRLVQRNPRCAVFLNEVFQPFQAQSGDAWQTEGRELLLSASGGSGVKAVAPQHLVPFVERVARRRCAEKTQQNTATDDDDDDPCHHHCIAVWKQFPEHLTREQHRHVLLTNRTMTTTVVLERAVEDRWTSAVTALQTGDWNVWGSPAHKARITALHDTIPPLNQSHSLFCGDTKKGQPTTEKQQQPKHAKNSVLCDFQEKHVEWYTFLRSLPSDKNRLYLRFEESTTRSAVDKIVQMLPDSVRPLLQLASTRQ